MLEAVALDLDGVLWLGPTPLPGAAEAVQRLRSAGVPVAFVTNNSSATVADVEAKLAAMGVTGAGDVVTSAGAAAQLVEPGERVLVCGGPGIKEAVTARGAVPVADGAADAVLVGFDRGFDYERLRVATAAVRGGARFIATNDDPTYPTPDGPIPGGGALVAAVATAAETAPTIAGKPHEPMAELVRARLGPRGVMVGDRPSTDGEFATTMGYRFGLVLSGVTHAEDLPVSPEPQLVGTDLAAIVDQVLG